MNSFRGFKIGDIVETTVDGSRIGNVHELGATAKVIGFDRHNEWLQVDWIKGHKTQMDGSYNINYFKLKDMKPDSIKKSHEKKSKINFLLVDENNDERWEFESMTQVDEKLKEFSDDGEFDDTLVIYEIAKKYRVREERKIVKTIEK